MTATSLLLPTVHLIDVAFVVVTAAWVTVATIHSRHGALEAAVMFLWSSLALVAGVGTILSWLGGLGPAGFLAGHLLLFTALAMARWKRRAADAAVLWSAWDAIRAAFARSGPTGWGLRALALVLICLAVMSVLAAPVVYDGLCYRLPRIGSWLQAGRIGMLDTADTRLNYMSPVADLVMAWFLGGGSEGYRGAALAQAIGGMLAVAATIGLARLSGMGRGAALLAGALLLGCANVFVQFTTTQTDLLTAGVTTAAIFLGLAALRRGESSWAAGIGAGFALGAKGTVAYMVPSVAVWLAFAVWRWRPPRAVMVRVGLAVAVGAALFAAPGWMRNFATYGHALGPAAEVQRHQRIPASPPAWGEKLGRNLLATAAQWTEPHAQPFGLRDAARWLGNRVADCLPTTDSDSFEARGRQSAVREVLGRGAPDADTLSAGLVIAFLVLAGFLRSVIRPSATGAEWIRVWAFGAALYFLFQGALLQWHVYAFRFHVLIAPWLAIVAAWALDGLSGRARTWIWICTLAAMVQVAAHVTLHTHQSGWRAIAEPERSRGFFVYENWRDWARGLSRESSTLDVALPENLPIAAFFRLGDGTRARLSSGRATATAEVGVPADGGWLVVPVGRFAGCEGRVVARTWLFQGDDGSVFSLAAYRRARPEEHISPVVYRHQVQTSGCERRHYLLVRSWPERPASMVVTNPGPGTVACSIATPLGMRTISLAPAADVALTLSLPPDALAEVSVKFSAETGELSASGPTVRIR